MSEPQEFESVLEAYPVKLEMFEGPLDLLLHLIKKHEVNNYDIPIALVTRQYLEYLELMQELNLDVAGEFLVMAATLIHIKSRMLLPRPDPSQEDSEEDPRDLLVRRLLEHQKYKAAAELLHERETVRKKVMQMYTDPKRIRADIPGTVEGNPVFMYHDAFNPDTAEVEDLKARYRAGTVGDVEVKKKLAAAINAVLDPMRERRAALVARPDRVREIAHEGSRRARVIAQETMARVREAVKLKY